MAIVLKLSPELRARELLDLGFIGMKSRVFRTQFCSQFFVGFLSQVPGFIPRRILARGRKRAQCLHE